MLLIKYYVRPYHVKYLKDENEKWKSVTDRNY